MKVMPDARSNPKVSRAREAIKIPQITRRTNTTTTAIVAMRPSSSPMFATGLVVIAFLLIGISGVYIALNARDKFGSQLAFGVTLLICFQAIINIAVVTSLFPNKGIALPFISAGGSSLLAMLMGVGILFSVARQGVAGKITATDFATNDNPFAAKTK